MTVHSDIKRIVDNALANPSAPGGHEWFVSHDNPHRDVNREVVTPGSIVDQHSFPEGAMIIRVDDDFYSIALLPYELSFYDFRTVLKIIWPDVNYTIRPDSHDPLNDTIHSLYETNREQRQAILDGAQEWPITILEVDQPKKAKSSGKTTATMGLRDKIRFRNEIDGQEYTCQSWSFQIPSFVKPGLKTIAIGKIISENEMRFNLFDFKARGAHTYTTVAGTDLNWKFGYREPNEDTPASA